jgi:membrane protease YdiL (CAAX protease family)
MSVEPTQFPAEAKPKIWDWIDILLIFLVTLALLAAGIFALVRLSGIDPANAMSEAGTSLVFNAELAAVETIALAGSVYLVATIRRKDDWKQIGLALPDGVWMSRAVVVALVFIPLLGLIAQAIQLILGLPLENPQLEFLVPRDFTWPGAIAMIILGGIAVPFAEELFFRGVLYRWLRDRWGIWVGLIASSLVFGALHGDIAVAGATAVMGLILGWFYERSRSLWPSILIHAINNTVKLVLLYALVATGTPIQ